MGAMEGIIIVSIMTITICSTVYGLFDLLVRRKERLAIIEKLSEGKDFGQINGKIDFSFGNNSFSFWALRCGCLLVGLGLGLIVGFYLSSTALGDFGGDVTPRSAEIAGVVYGGSLLLFGGLGLLLAFILETKYDKKKEKE